jgi:hypothetical protein
MELPLLTKASIYMHKYSESSSLRTFGICPGMISPLGYKILTELPTIGQDTIVSSTLLPLSKEVLSDYTKFVSKVLKLYTRQRLGQHICNMFICANIMELYSSSLHHIINEVIQDIYVLRLIMEHIIFIQVWLSHRITVASISRSNRSVTQHLKKLSESSSNLDLIDLTMYMHLIGSLMYLVNTTPDQIFVMQ